jgi:hypothetical protein
MIAMFQAFAFVSFLFGIVPHGLVESPCNISRHENSFVAHTGHLRTFAINQGSKSLEGQPAGNLFATELIHRKNDETVHLSPNYAEHAYRSGIVCISLIRSPPAISPL